jgi:hypothetical protein
MLAGIVAGLFWDRLRAGLFKDRPQFYKNIAIQFYGPNRPDATVSAAGPDCGVSGPAHPPNPTHRGQARAGPGAGPPRTGTGE